MREEHKKKRLVELGPEVLADALLEISERSDLADSVIERLSSTPGESLKRVRSRIAGQMRATRFVDWRGVPRLADQLREILSDIEAADPDPLTGVELVAEFYRCDDPVFSRCDDSSGIVADVFKRPAGDVFVRYARACEDKSRVGDILLKLCLPAQRRIRSVLIDSASKFLPEDEMRRLVDVLIERWEREPSDTRIDSNEYFLLMSLAKQLRDASLFEEVVTATWPDVHGSACLDIARLYLDSGDPEMALSWIERFPPHEFHRGRERDELLLSVFERLGDREGVEKTAWKIFRRERSSGALNKLMLVIGEANRQGVVEQEMSLISESERFSYSDSLFLVKVGQPDAAEDYLLKHESSIDGDAYFALLPIAEGLEEAGRPLGASVVYRALLESILSRAQSKYYHHGVRYMKKLDELAPGVTCWKGIATHKEYKTRLLAAHGRKRSFWSRYESDAQVSSRKD